MNPRTRKSLDKILHEMERRARRPRWRFSTAPFVLGLGLILADVMLTVLVPVIWESLLPRGLEQADSFVGWPGLVWRGAIYCGARQRTVLVAIGVVTVLGVLSGSAPRPVRLLVWVSAAGVIALNALILIVTIQTSLRATASAAGLDLG